MPTVTELSDPYTAFMRNPLMATAASTCEICRTFTEGWDTCFPCGHQISFADAVAPISYSEHFGQLHTSLASYKRAARSAAMPVRLQLAAVLWRFLDLHEACVARAAGVPGFELVTTVPSSDPRRDDDHPLRWLVSEVILPTASRFERLLMRSGTPVEDRTVDPLKYSPARSLDNEPVLLIDDTWTTGANAQSAAGSLKLAGAGPVAVVTIGRHVNPDYKDNSARLRALSPFRWDICAVH